LALALAACGGGSDQSTDVSATTHAPPRPRAPTVKMSKAEIAKLAPLTIPKPIPPPPRKLAIVDLRKGSGPGVPKHDWVTNREELFTRYVEAGYPEARAGVVNGPYTAKNLLLEGASKWLARGVIGMKVGGRRELVIPPKLAYPNWKPSWGYVPFSSIYVIDLVGMEPPPDRRVEYRNRPFGKQG